MKESSYDKKKNLQQEKIEDFKDDEDVKMLWSTVKMKTRIKLWKKIEALKMRK